MNYISNFTEKLFFNSWQSLSWSRNSLPFVEPKRSSMCSKELATRPHPEPANSSPYLHSNSLKIHINNTLPSRPRSHQAGWWSSNALHSYMEDPWFESWLAHRLSLVWFFVVSLSCSRQVLGYYLDKEIAYFFQILSNSSITLPLEAIQSKSWQCHKITQKHEAPPQRNFFKHLSLSVVLRVPSI
jgi:hypothetical protein